MQQYNYQSSLNTTPTSYHHHVSSTSLSTSSSSSSSPSFYSDDGSDDYNDIERDAIEKGIYQPFVIFSSSFGKITLKKDSIVYHLPESNTSSQIF